MVIADSSIWIDFQRDPGSEAGRELDRLLAIDEVVMVGPVLTEVLQGARSEGEFEFFASHLTALLFLETSQDTWVRAGELNYQLKQHGNILENMVVFISMMEVFVYPITVYQQVIGYNWNMITHIGETLPNFFPRKSKSPEPYTIYQPLGGFLGL